MRYSSVSRESAALYTLKVGGAVDAATASHPAAEPPSESRRRTQIHHQGVHQQGDRRNEDRDLEQAPVFGWGFRDRKSTRLNSSHVAISYAVFCLKKKNNKNIKRA